MTELVIAAILAVAAGVVLWVVLPERLRAPVLGILGAVAGTAWALLGRRRPDAPAAPQVIDAAAEGEARRVERIEATHADAEAEVAARVDLEPDERRRRTAGEWR